MTALSKTETGGPKVTIVGAGFVGTTFAHSLIILGLVLQIAIIDISKERERYGSNLRLAYYRTTEKGEGLLKMLNRAQGFFTV